jgi:hypothetical protein
MNRVLGALGAGFGSPLHAKAVWRHSSASIRFSGT